MEKKRNRGWSAIVGVILASLALYGASYYGTVGVAWSFEDDNRGIPIAVAIPVYSLPDFATRPTDRDKSAWDEQFTYFFAPVHLFDRQLRPNVWYQKAAIGIPATPEESWRWRSQWNRFDQAENSPEHSN
jgi:hypothetical protein